MRHVILYLHLWYDVWISQKVKFQKKREVWYIYDLTYSKIYFDIVCIYDTWYFTYVSIYRDWISQNNQWKWEDSEMNERKFRRSLKF